MLAFALLTVDVLAVALAFGLSFQFRLWLPLLPPLAHGADLYLEAWPFLFLWPLSFWLYNLYPGWWYTASEELRRLVWGSTLAGLLIMSATFITRTGPQYSRPIVVGGWLLALVLVPALRIPLKRLLAGAGLAGPPAIVLGAAESAEVFIDGMRRLKPPPYSPVALFDDDPQKQGQTVAGTAVVGTLNQAPGWAKKRKIGTAIIAMPGVERARLVRIIHFHSEFFPRIIVIPNLFGIAASDVTPRQVQGVLGLELRQNLLYWHARAFKRLIDLCLLIVLAPFILAAGLLIALAIWIESGRPIFFVHPRIGRGGESFMAWKFRSMMHAADEAFKTRLEKDTNLRQELERTGKIKQDPRLTRVGAFLRRMSLDELPQFWNVLKGDMSLVGPRPIIEGEIPKYGEALDLYKQVRPGLTGLWQVSGRSDLPYADRVWLDSHYVRNWSIWLDVIILIRTVGVVLTGRGAY
jgi:Undecaprenyl-phosphate galactose phosphotransferase WbaP